MRTLKQALLTLAYVTLGGVAAACGGDDGGADNEQEVFTTVTLTFTPSAGGTPITASVDDADGDGGNPPVITPISLPAGMYDLSIKFENKLETPAEDLTAEVRDESGDHQLFFTGTAVNGPASNQPAAPLTHAYADTDPMNLPVGLVNKITAMPGMGNLTLTLRHLPPVNNVAVKTSTLAETVRTSMGFATIPGGTDIAVTLPVTVM